MRPSAPRVALVVALDALAFIAALTAPRTGNAQVATGIGAADAVLARGATGAGNVEYSLSNADSAQQAALGKAVANAQRQAAAIASALGGSLGPVIMSTTGEEHDGRVVLGYGQGPVGDAFGTGPSIKPAEISVDATVVVRWRYLFR